jgi:hypothetical protein
MNDENTGFEAYKLFNSLKLHFTNDNYCFFKYNGKSNSTKEKFMINKNRFFFYKLSRKFCLDDLKDFLVSNFVYSDSIWVNEMMTPEAEIRYKMWLKNTQSISYIFEQDVDTIMKDVENPNDLLKMNEGGYPKLLMEVMEKNITIESFVILNNILNFFPSFDKKIEDDIIWPNFRTKCQKYEPFLEYNKSKLKLILKEKVKEYA